MRKKFTMLFAALLACVGVMAQLTTNQYYKIKNANSDLYLQVVGDNTNMQLRKDAGTVLQLFQLEDAGEGKFYLKSVKGETSYYAHASGWNFNATTTGENKTAFVITEKDDLYTLYQTASEYPGYAGTDATDVASSIYCNKGENDNAKWIFEPVSQPKEVKLETGKNYRLRSDVSGLYMQCADYAMTSGEGAFQLKTKSADEGQTFQLEAADDDKYYLKTVKGETVYYVKAASWNFFASTDKTTPFTIAKVDGEYSLFSIFQENVEGALGGYAGNIDNGANATDGTKLYCNQPNLTGNTVWFFEEIEDEVVQVTYKYKYDGVEKCSETLSAVVGAEFPEPTYFAPYGVVVGDKPAGKVESEGTHDIVLTVTKELPFKTDTWYYVQMHAYPNYSFYISSNNTNLIWHGGVNDPAAREIAADATMDDYLWKFEGDLWNGFKMVNMSKKAVVSEGKDGVTVTSEVEKATAFIPAVSQAGGEWFCMKHSSGNYLNLNTGNSVINHWSANDNGSSMFVTEYDKAYTIDVLAAAGYATYYSQYRLAIPETVEVYVVSAIEGESAVLQQVTGVLPAKTAVILKGVGEHSFVTSAATPATIETNLLRGTTQNTYVAGTAYVLANGAKGVGLYKAALNKDENGAEGTTHFLNNANKAYLVVEGANAPMFSFNRGEGTTSIEDVELINDNVVIYDLTGRRVEKMEKGIYIVNGKKVLVK